MRDAIPRSISLKDKLKQSKGFEITNRINKFSLTHYIFKKNFDDLIAIIKKQTEPKNSMRLREFDHKKEFEELQFETIRLLHNYISSVLSLIDHTRVFVRELYSNNQSFAEEYQKKVTDTFTSNPICVFVISFRQYIQHYQTPLISTVSNLTDDPELLNTRITISKEQLLAFSGWKSHAKIYIANLDKELDVLRIIEDYNEIIKEFYRWFQERQREIHKPEFEEMRKINIKMLDAQIEELIFCYINYEECKTPYFFRELTRYMSDIEKKVFIDSTKKDQLNYIYSIAEKKKIHLTKKQKTALKIKYSR